MLSEQSPGTDMLLVTGSQMSGRLADIAQLTLWTCNFVNHVTFKRVRHRGRQIRHTVFGLFEGHHHT